MRPMRWKSRYRIGNVAADRRNRAYVDCLNSLITALGQREHCREMEDFVDRCSSEADEILQAHPADRDLNHELGHRLLASLPLDPFGGNACRKCGLCEVKQKKVAKHLEDPVQCLFQNSDP